MKYLLLFVISLMLTYICYTDVKFRRIENLSVVGVFIASVIVGYLYSGAGIVPALLFLFFGFIVSLFGLIGGGDIKLIFALLLSVPNKSIFPFFSAVCYLGIPVALIVMWLFGQRKSKSVPFGVAISVGYIMVASSGYV